MAIRYILTDEGCDGSFQQYGQEFGAVVSRFQCGGTRRNRN